MAIQTSAPAKIILFGEHAVVYGQPAIAVPIASLRAIANAEPSNDNLTIVAHDLNNKIISFNGDDPLAEAARLTLQALDIPPPQARITVQSNIPIASGLGSGAAITAAVIRALCQVTGKALPTETINALVYEVEKIHHGTPSGIDNTVVVYEQAVYFVRNQPIERIINAEAFTLLVADTGQTALTKVAVGDVRRLLETEPKRMNPIIETIGEIVRDARRAMQQGDILQLGKLMKDNHQLLQQLTVSSPQLDRLVYAAQDSGALGAKLSGGGRGGNMIALVTDVSKARVQAALEHAGAVRVFATTVERTAL